jgi:hypothetical protein
MRQPAHTDTVARLPIVPSLNNLFLRLPGYISPDQTISHNVEQPSEKLAGDLKALDQASRKVQVAPI